MRDGERRVVLDLGDPHTDTVEYFSGFRVRLGIASLFPALVALDAEQDETRLQADLETLLPEGLVSGSQLVLAWDVLNYLRPRAISAFMSRLADLLPRGAQVHGFVAYGVKLLPETPRALVVCPDGWLRMLPADGDATREAPGRASGELQRLMPDFRVERAILLGDGMQEYLFRRQL